MERQGFGSDSVRFRTEYTKRFLSALRSITNGRNDLCKMRAVKFAADVSLAMTAANSSPTTWSRTILSRSFVRPKPCNGTKIMRRRIRSMRKRRMRSSRAVVNGGKRGARINVLKRLVPGGAAVDTPLLLEEASDYIRALQMQVHSMNSLFDYFANALVQCE